MTITFLPGMQMTPIKLPVSQIREKGILKDRYFAIYDFFMLIQNQTGNHSTYFRYNLVFRQFVPYRSCTNLKRMLCVTNYMN